MRQKVIVISNSSRKTSNRGRKVIDGYLPRVGDDVWLGILSNEGIEDLKEKLVKVRSKYMHVICKIIGPYAQDKTAFEIGNNDDMWDNGNMCIKTRTINAGSSSDEGAVITEKEIPNMSHQQSMLSTAISVASIMHDIGKMSKEFQKKLRKDTSKKDVVRHEIVSLCIFDVLCEDKSEQPLDAKRMLAAVRAGIENALTLQDRSRLHLDNTENAFRHAVRFIIMTHHRLPAEIGILGGVDAKASNYLGEKGPLTVSPTDVTAFFSSESGKHIIDRIQAAKALMDTSEAGVLPGLMPYGRTCMMWGDHFYSGKRDEFPSIPTTAKGYFANSSSEDGKRSLKQPLDTHLLGVEQAAVEIINHCMHPFEELKTSTGLRYSSNAQTTDKFAWQGEVEACCTNVNASDGFIGFMLAGTGTGKTRANVIAATAVSQGATRLSVLMGLRSLTLQTKRAFSDFMREPVYMHIGSEVLVRMHDADTEGSETEDAVEKLDIDDNPGNHTNAFIDKFIPEEWREFHESPVLVSTIDALMSTERHPSMAFRLMTSDIILDEIDDYDILDQGAILRLIYMSATYSRRIIVSSATISPALCEAIYRTYQAGYAEHCNIFNKDNNITCGWFSEFAGVSRCHRVSSLEDFTESHGVVVTDILQNLTEQSPKRLASILPIDTSSWDGVFQSVVDGCVKMHGQHGMCLENGRKLSVGFIRIADVSSVAELSRYIASIDIPGVTHGVVCYHSNFPMTTRNRIETWLDDVCNRKSPERILAHPDVRTMCETGKDVMIFVVASPIEEVGRDHDFDYLISFPSSMKSLVQACGRVQRHRHHEATSPNCLITEYPMSYVKKCMGVLKGKNLRYFSYPGVETDVDVDIDDNHKSYLNTHECSNVFAIPADGVMTVNAENCLKNTGIHILSEMEHRKSRRILAGGGADKISALSCIVEMKRFLSMGYRLFEFRKKNRQDCMFIQKETGSWSAAYYNKGMKTIPGVKNIVDIQCSDERFLIKQNTEDFAALKSMYLSDKTDEIAEMLLSSVTVSITFKNGLPVFEPWLYHGSLGLFKSFSA